MMTHKFAEKPDLNPGAYKLPEINTQKSLYVI